jgi:hypothetical protein
VQPSFPLFRRPVLYAQYQRGALPRGLLLAIFAVSVRFSDMIAPDDFSISNQLARQAALTTPSVEDSDGPLTLDDVRTACLLAYHAFHTLPGRRAWTQVGKVTRMAYNCGLHQVDNRANCVLYQDGVTDEGDLEESRYVWWCIYCMDSYCNITAATPFGIELDSLRTALVSTSIFNFTEDRIAPTTQTFLHSEPNYSWRTLKELKSSTGERVFNFCIIITSVLREASNLRRLLSQNPSDRIRNRLRELDNNVSSIKLALPPRFLNPARDMSSLESKTVQHTRLMTLLQFHTTCILISLPEKEPSTAHADKSRQNWESCLSYADDILTALRQWDRQFSFAADPATCLIVWLTMCLFHLQSRLEMQIDQTLEGSYTSAVDLLMLVLEDFARYWQLPRILLRM